MNKNIFLYTISALAISSALVAHADDTTSTKKYSMSKAAGAVEHGAEATGKDTEKAGKHVVKGTENGLKAIGTDTKKGGQAVWRGTTHSVKAVGSGMKKGAKKLTGK